MSEGLRNAYAKTMKNRTGSGGEHVILRLAEPITDITTKTIWREAGEHSEIKIKCNGGYIVAAPSIHPNGNKYEWNGKELQPITRQQLDEFISLVGLELTTDKNTELNNLARTSTDLSDREETRTLTPEQMQNLLRCVQPVYIPGDRNDVVFCLSGAMRKEGITHQSTRQFVTLLSNAAKEKYYDEDLRKSLEKVDRTYSLPIQEVNGKSGLWAALIGTFGDGGKGAFEEICQHINNLIFLPDTDINIVSTKNATNKVSENIVVKLGKPNEEEEVIISNETSQSQKSVLIELDDSTPGVWLQRQMDADNKLDTIGTLRDEILRREKFMTITDTQEIRWYHEGAYLSGGEHRIHELAVQLGGSHASTHVVHEILRNIRYDRRRRKDRSDFDKYYYLVNCRNCVVDLRTGECFPHDPDRFLFTYMIPWSYNKGGRPNSDEEFEAIRKVLHFLYNIMHPSDVVVVLEHIGHCLITDSSLFQKALMLAGPPNQGKSKLVGLIQALLGKQNVSNKTLQQLAEDKFSRAPLYGKLANVFADLESKKLSNISMFKVIVSGDVIDARFLFQDSFTFPPYAKLIYSANQPPLLSEDLEDEDDAFYRRWDVVGINLRKTCFFNERTKYSLVKNDRCRFCAETNRRIEKDPKLLEKLVEDEEAMSGLLSLAIQSAMRLLRNNGFTHRPDIETVREQYLRKAEPVKAWADACCVFDIFRFSEGVDKQRMHSNFVAYCHKHGGLPTVDIAHLARKLKSLYSIGDRHVGPRGDRKHVWTGIMLRKDLREKGQLGLDEADEIVE